jgi:methionyl-tRNA formyltransferase
LKKLFQYSQEVNLKKIFVVSDNVRLVQFFQEECKIQGQDKIYEIIYKYSAINKNPTELIELGMSPVDMKNESHVVEILNDCHLILSLHCKQIFPARVVKSTTCINIHPGLNPFNRGWYPQVFSIINKKPIGATIHRMDVEIDNGEIIDQLHVDILDSDTSLAVYNKVYEAEKILLSKNIKDIFSGNFISKSPKEVGNYNGISDFKNLCKLNLDDISTLKNHIDLLRALSHGDFKNAYFIDEKTGKKIYVSLSLTEGE